MHRRDMPSLLAGRAAICLGSVGWYQRSPSPGRPLPPAGHGGGPARGGGHGLCPPLPVPFLWLHPLARRHGGSGAGGGAAPGSAAPLGGGRWGESTRPAGCRQQQPSGAGLGGDQRSAARAMGLGKFIMNCVCAPCLQSWCGVRRGWASRPAPRCWGSCSAGWRPSCRPSPARQAPSPHRRVLRKTADVTRPAGRGGA